MKTTRGFVPFSRNVRRAAKKPRRAFTVLEMLVALAVFSVLLVAVFVPIKLAGDLSGVGTARASAQQAAVEGIRQMRLDIKKAIVILPNDRTAGVTDVYPYVNLAVPASSNEGFPYRRDAQGYIRPTTRDTTGSSNLNACRTGTVSVGTPAVNRPIVSPAPSTSRLDLILPATGVNSNVNPQIKVANVLVSYYPRRLDITKAFDPVNNPVVLFRTQIPYQYYDAAGALKPFPVWGAMAGPPYNADLSNQRFDNLGTGTCNARSLQWLTMNQYGEFDLTPLALPPAGSSATLTGTSPTFGSNQLVLPRDTALITPYAATDTDDNQNGNMSLVPDTTFVCSDANKDGKIDTVTIQLSVGQYDENSVNRRTVPTPTPGAVPNLTPAPHAALQPQVARTLTETVFDPNVQ